MSFLPFVIPAIKLSYAATFWCTASNERAKCLY